MNPNKAQDDSGKPDQTYPNNFNLFGYSSPYLSHPQYYGAAQNIFPLNFGTHGVIATSNQIPEPRTVLPGGLPPWRQRAPGYTVSVNPTKISTAAAIAQPIARPAAVNHSSEKQNTWPPSLNKYVEKCFSTCATDGERDKMESSLRTLINEAIHNGSLYTTNWSALSVPGSPIASLNTNHAASNTTFEDRTKKKMRKERFATSTNISVPKLQYDSDGPIIGLSESIEKQYFRLTSAPNPHTVRPLPVLQKSLEYILTQWKNGREYVYLCDQLKSVRQDLTVQGIKNEFTVEVYETHARIALENNDFGEYNQCQSQLKLLYFSGLVGNVGEFMTYRFLYLLLTNNSIDFNEEIFNIPDSFKVYTSMQHILCIQKCYQTLDLSRFLLLATDLPKHGKILIAPLVEKVRNNLLDRILISSKLKISTSSLAEILCFKENSQCLEFIQGRMKVENGFASVIA